MPAKLSAGSGVGEGVGRGDGERVIDGDVLRAAFSCDWLSLLQATHTNTPAMRMIVTALLITVR